MRTCPQCQSTERQVKNGQTVAGSQRYWCQGCGRKYTPVPKAHSYPPEVRALAVRLSSEGWSRRGIARHLGVAHQSVSNWVTRQAAVLAEAPPPPAAVDPVWTATPSSSAARAHRACSVTAVDGMDDMDATITDVVGAF